MKKFIFLALIAMLWSFRAHAEIVVVQAKGYGDTYEQAVESALGDAIKQVNGATVATQSAGPKVYAQLKESGEARISGNAEETINKDTKEGGVFHDTVSGNKETTTTSLDAHAQSSSKTTLEAGIGSTTDVRSQGKVKSYRTVSQQCTDKGCEVSLEVSIEKFEYKSKTAKLDRDSIAVVTTGRLRNSPTAVQLRQSVSDKLVKTGRFTVLDRSNEAEFEKELGFLESDKVSDQERARLGQAVGADFMLILNVVQAGVATRTTETHVDMTGESDRQVSHSTSASMRYTLVESATRAVRWSDSMTFRSGGSKLSSAMDGFLNKIVGDIAEVINPPKVIGIHNGRIIINRGMGIASTGQNYEIYSVGEALIDPDTGESLGATEEQVATIQINDVKAKVAYGILVSGSAEAIEKGATARLKKTAPAKTTAKKARKKTAPAKSDQNIDEAGGVIL